MNLAANIKRMVPFNSNDKINKLIGDTNLIDSKTY